ncbi:MAG TPA: hypothetical protein VJ436_13565 [Anaerolineales bacterium]|nr:hypothetical protein [Anaerolineales bacterium]
MLVTDPGLVAISVAIYRLLLTFYPTRFRREYGSQMAQVFRDCCLRTYRQSGPPGMFALWAFTLFELFVFGLAALRNKPMRRGNGLPALAGFWWPSIVILAYVFPQVMRRLGPEVPFWLSFSLFSAMGLFLALLGYVLQSDAPRVKET